MLCLHCEELPQENSSALNALKWSKENMWGAAVLLASCRSSWADLSGSVWQPIDSMNATSTYLSKIQPYPTESILGLLNTLHNLTCATQSHLHSLAARHYVAIGRRRQMRKEERRGREMTEARGRENRVMRSNSWTLHRACSEPSTVSSRTTSWPLPQSSLTGHKGQTADRIAP